MAETPGQTELDTRPQSRREWSGYLRSLVLPVGLVVLIVAGLLYWQSRGDTQADSEYGTVSLPAERNLTGKDPAASEHRAAPDFYLETLNGGAVRLSDFQGKPVLINFWASWCGPCRDEMPLLLNAYESRRFDGLVVLGVNLREGEDRVRSFADSFGISFPVAFDRDGEVARTWRIGGPTEGLPSSYFIDSQGVIQKVVFGAMSAKTLAEGLSLILPAN